jgi:uncharacterized protein (DUF2164 family)
MCYNYFNTDIKKVRNGRREFMYIKFPKERRDQIKSSLQQYFFDVRGEEIGELAAENFLHFITENVGSYYYNKGVEDARHVLEEKTASLEEELLSLERPIELNKRN